MSKLFIAVIVLSFIITTGCSSVDEGKLIDIVHEMMEQGYFDGQLDCIRGDIRIDSTGCFRVKNPRDNFTGGIQYIPDTTACK